MALNNSHFSQPSNIFYKKRRDGVYVLANAEEEDFTILELEGSGSDIWEKLTLGISYNELLNWMIENYEADEASLKNDLDEFLEDLILKGFLVSTQD